MANTPPPSSNSAAARPDQAASELMVLSVLADGPLYGYAISKRIAAGSEGGITLSPGLLYPLLAKLEKQGLISSSWEEVKSDRAEADAAGRRRKWYRLSTKGRRRLDQRLADQRAFLAMIESFLRGSPGAAPETQG